MVDKQGTGYILQGEPRNIEWVAGRWVLAEWKYSPMVREALAPEEACNRAGDNSRDNNLRDRVVEGIAVRSDWLQPPLYC